MVAYDILRPQILFCVDRIERLCNTTNGIIQEKSTGRKIETQINRISSKEIASIHKKDGWKFDWKKELRENPDRQVYGLRIKGDEKIQGLISFEPKYFQNFILAYLIELAPHNFGRNKKYEGAAKNLVAFACMASFELGLGGVVAFDAKTKLIEHYQNVFGAQVIFRSNRMAIFTPAAKKLVISVYKNCFNEQDKNK